MLRVTSFGKFENEWRDRYIKQTKQLIPVEWTQIPIKKSPDKRTSQLLPEEAKFLRENSNFFLLDADGRSMTSKELASWCFKSSRHLVVGPAIGFAQEFKDAALGLISLSSLTFTHSLAQTMLAEALYRSACILRNHPFVK